jgi:hypothetical protein
MVEHINLACKLRSTIKFQIFVYFFCMGEASIIFGMFERYCLANGFSFYPLLTWVKKVRETESSQILDVVFGFMDLGVLQLNYYFSFYDMGGDMQYLSFRVHEWIVIKIRQGSFEMSNQMVVCGCFD